MAQSMVPRETNMSGRIRLQPKVINEENTAMEQGEVATQGGFWGAEGKYG